MFGGKPCGRAIHPAPKDVDEIPVCLMHSRDPNKSDAEFQREFESILEGAGDGLADFTGFVFPSSNFGGRTFKGTCVFSGATFAQYATFFRATFKEANFSGATFAHAADFCRATFAQAANFAEATFAQHAYFSGATFKEAASLSWATFAEAARFSGATFKEADFAGATFKEADFAGATFAQDADFSWATFAQDADFSWATFAQHSDFSWATFAQHADFSWATFQQRASIRKANIRGVLDFSEIQFGKDAQVLVERTNRLETVEIPDWEALQEKPELFSIPREKWPWKTLPVPGLHLRLTNTLADCLRFEDVHWNKESGRLVLQDELDLRANEPGVTHELVAQAYRRLVINFEKGRQYELAEECVVGEMEMRRRDPERFFYSRWLSPPNFLVHWQGTPVVGSVGKWPGEHLSFTRCYKLLSHYGTSYQRAFFWLLLMILLIFPALYGVAGLSLRDGDPISFAQKGPAVRLEHHLRQVSWSRAWAPPGKTDSRAAELLITARETLLFSLEVATFQRERVYEPSEGWGRFFVVLETIAVPGQLTLVLLALRRRFRR
jgi:uncharacterized protein YjbI with pentapeptide repeats